MAPWGGQPVALPPERPTSEAVRLSVGPGAAGLRPAASLRRRYFGANGEGRALSGLASVGVILVAVSDWAERCDFLHCAWVSLDLWASWGSLAGRWPLGCSTVYAETFRGGMRWTGSHMPTFCEWGLAEGVSRMFFAGVRGGLGGGAPMQDGPWIAAIRAIKWLARAANRHRSGGLPSKIQGGLRRLGPCWLIANLGDDVVGIGVRPTTRQRFRSRGSLVPAS